MKKIWISAIVAIILIALVFAIRPAITGNTVNEKQLEMDTFAQCLTDAGAVMYGTDWCSHCQNQKKSFGKSFKKIKFVDCDRNSLLCTSEGITGYPTWKIDGQSYPGEQSFSNLGRLAGCEVPN